MKIYRLTSQQQLPISLGKAWLYFSDVSKLPELTPDLMRFTVTGPLPKEMYPGMIATYRLQPFPNIWVNWVTEITHVQDCAYFIDEQRFGPYRFWHHGHHFKEMVQGVEMTDIVHYALPFHFLGRAVHKLSVEKKLQKIFEYRRHTLEQLFGFLPM